MPDKFNELTSFLDSQLDKLHVLVNKPQDIDFDDVTNEQTAQPPKQTDKERFEAKLAEMRNSSPTNSPKKDYYQRERSLFNDLER